MWKYYKESNICFAYLEDVVDPEAGWGNDQPVGKSEWFTRGWTLQELIAPYNVEFYSSGWQPIGTKLERYQELADITGIDPDILCNYRRMSTPSTAEKLSWAAHRAVTKEEDEAYSLFGLFDVNLPLLYGEGRLKAFARLQEAIYDTTSDHSIFLEVLAPKEKGVRVTHEMPTFLKANKPSDRLAVTLPDGERVFVKLQRLPAFARGHADGQTAKLRYMISVESEVK
ncbi:unnamed protein product [Alternaria alternata]